MKHTLRRVLTSKLLIIPVVAVSLYALVGFALLPALVRWAFPKFAREQLGCEATVDAVRFNPFRLQFEMSGMKLNDPDGVQLAAFQRLFMDLQAAGINRWTAMFREIRLEKPSLTVVLQKDGSTNLQKLFSASQGTSEPPPEPPSEPTRMILQNVAIVGGRLEVLDRRQPTPAELKIEEFDLTLKDLATVGNRNGTYALSASTHEGETLEWEGDVTLTPIHSRGKISLSNLRSRTLWEFVRDRLNIEPPGGFLNISCAYLLDAASGPMQLSLEGLQMDVSDLSLEVIQTDKPTFHLNKAQLQVPRFDLQSGVLEEGLQLDATDISLKMLHTDTLPLELRRAELKVPRFDLQSRVIKEANLLIDGGSASVHLDSNGEVNLTRIAVVKPPTGEKHSDPPLPRGNEQPPLEETPASPTGPPFKLLDASIHVKGIAFSFEDMSRPTPLMARLADLDLQFKTEMEMSSGESKVVLKDTTCEVKGVHFGAVRSQSPVFKVERFSVEGAELDMNGRSLVVSRVALANGQADVVRDREGRIDWLQLLGVGPEAGAATASTKAKGGGTPWKFMVKSLQLENLNSALSDLTVSPDKSLYNIRALRADLSDVDGKSPFGFTAGFQLDQGGNASLNGRVNPSDGSVETEVTINDFPLLPLRPFLDPHVNLTLRSAFLTTRGKLRNAVAGAGAKLIYEGSLNLSKLAFSEPNSETTYLGVDSMVIPELKFTAEPNRLDAVEVALFKPLGELIIATDGSVNVTKWVKSGGEAGKSSVLNATASRGGTEAFPFRIGKMRIENGNMAFADYSLRPYFMTKIHEMKGTVMGLSSASNSQARVQLNGRVDQYGVAKIDGELSLYDPKRSTEVDMVFRNVEMNSLSPYAGKFAGRRIKSGRLSLDLKYKVKESKLVGDNKIIVDNLVLGERVESPDAVNLPLDLAITLLQDSKGRIDIGLPVTGDLDNPQFTIVPLIWKGIVNVIKKVLTAPFRALGGASGGEEKDFTTTAFEPGKAELPPPEKEKLKKLADLIKNKPQLKLVVQGQYSTQADGMEFKELAVRRAVAATRGAKLGPGEDPGPLDFADSKTRDALEELYKERFGKAELEELRDGIRKGTIKPQMPEPDQGEQGKGGKRGRLRGLVDRFKIYKVIPGGMSSDESTMLAVEITARLMEAEPVSDESLRELAQARAKTIIREMETTNGITSNRLAAGEPEPAADGGEPAAKLSLDTL